MLSALAAELEALDVVVLDTSIVPAARQVQRRLLTRSEVADVLRAAVHSDLKLIRPRLALLNVHALVARLVVGAH